jgi:AmiR/NasT family two-component response regulator
MIKLSNRLMTGCLGQFTLRQALADRKIIEQAKGILMKLTGADEKDSFRRLQELAAERNQKLIDAAQNIVALEKVFRPAANN